MARSYYFVIKKKKSVSNLITSNSNKIALRIPNNKATLSLISHFYGIVGPSANKYNKISPTSKIDVIKSLGKEVDFILAGGRSEIGIESTIIDLVEKNKPTILRSGMISKSELEEKIQCKFYHKKKIKQVPGASINHYKPNALLMIIKKEEIMRIILHLLKNAYKIGLLGFNKISIKKKCLIHLKSSEKECIYARNLYKQLRLLDSKNVDIILVETVPNNEKWIGIKDRLKKASLKKNCVKYNKIMK